MWVSVVRGCKSTLTPEVFGYELLRAIWRPKLGTVSPTCRAHRWMFIKLLCSIGSVMGALQTASSKARP